SNPRFDPHGDPIPDPDGSVSELFYTPLSEIPAGESVEIRQADTSQPDRLRYIASFGLKPGTRVTVVDHQPFQGPITVQVGGESHILGHEIAMLLLGPRPGIAPGPRSPLQPKMRWGGPIPAAAPVCRRRTTQSPSPR